MNALKNTLIALAVAAPLVGGSVASAETNSAGSRTDGDSVRLGLGDWTSLGGSAVPSLPDSSLSGLTGNTSQGWQPMESLRLELEYLYRNSAANRVGSIAESTAAVDSRSLMANAMIDFKVTDWATPYVGVGVGLTRVDPAMTGFRGMGRDDVLAYQGIVGLSVPFSSSLSFFADGRYVRSDDFGLGFSGTDSTLQSWSALAGIRFTFGRGN